MRRALGDCQEYGCGLLGDRGSALSGVCVGSPQAVQSLHVLTCLEQLLPGQAPPPPLVPAYMSSL